MTDYGLGSVGATLAARTLLGPWTNWIVVNGGDVFRRRRFLLPPDMDSPYVELGFGPWVFGSHFPYTEPVEPDGPV